MQAFTSLTAIALPLLRDNIDTDAIIPSREIVSVSKTGLAQGLFAGWRYSSPERREVNPQFPLNDPAYRNAQILLTGANFGCGSSREHAVWALAEFGFRVLVAPSFNSIFFRNCVRNGIVAATLSQSHIDEIARRVTADPSANRVSIDLQAQSIGLGGLPAWVFAIAPEAKEMLLNGLDAIDLTLGLRDKIAAFRGQDRRRRPWAYDL